MNNIMSKESVAQLFINQKMDKYIFQFADKQNLHKIKEDFISFVTALRTTLVIEEFSYNDLLITFDVGTRAISLKFIQQPKPSMKDLYNHATNLAFESHKDQFDKSGNPYIYHPLHIANQLNTVEEKIVALLHDVIEDTDVTLSQLEEYGYPFNIIRAIDLLTKRHGACYDDYIKALSSNDLARRVKIQDLRHNLSVSRVEELNTSIINRLMKYTNALKYLREVESKVNNTFYIIKD